MASMMFDLSGIPDELKELPAWLAWHWARNPSKSKLTKRPRAIVRDSATNKASHVNPKCLRPLDDVLAFLEARPTWGIGFSFHFVKPWPLVGIDLDDCRDPGTGWD